MIRSDDNRILSRENYPEPASKSGVAALVREILEQPGAVHRIVIERGKNVIALRWVEKNEMMEEEQTLDGALRNAEIIEYSNGAFDLSPFEVVFDMVSLIRQTERSFPVCWATGAGTVNLLDKWFRIREQERPFDSSELLAIPVQRLKSLPEDVLILCGASFEDAEPKDVSVAIKTAIELKEEKSEQVIYRHVDRSGNHSLERGATTRALESGAGGNSRTSWAPSSFIRQRLVRGS